jgi:hypothetical protein
MSSFFGVISSLNCIILIKFLNYVFNSQQLQNKKWGAGNLGKYIEIIKVGNGNLRLPFIFAFSISAENIYIHVSLITEVQFREYLP